MRILHRHKWYHQIMYFYLEADVYVWCYTLLEVQARRRKQPITPTEMEWHTKQLMNSNVLSVTRQQKFLSLLSIGGVLHLLNQAGDFWSVYLSRALCCTKSSRLVYHSFAAYWSLAICVFNEVLMCGLSLSVCVCLTGSRKTQC